MMMTSDQQGSGPMLDAPRRVRGGVRLHHKERPNALGWAGRRWLRLAESAATDQAMEEGLEYARTGQTRSLQMEPGRIVASVQGRALRAYRVVIQLDSFTDDQWDAIVDQVAAQPRFGAPLLAGELPESILEVFGGLGLVLIPERKEDLLVTTTCPGSVPWAKHACCVGLLVAEALDRDPGLALTLRGLPLDELMERVRDRRADLGTRGAETPAASLETDLSVARPIARPLEACIDEFWEAGPQLERLETPIEAPEVTHRLLRRLGPSPFEGSRFPLVGLLATCYDVMSRAVLEREERALESEAPSDSERPSGAS